MEEQSEDGQRIEIDDLNDLTGQLLRNIIRVQRRWVSDNATRDPAALYAAVYVSAKVIQNAFNVKARMGAEAASELDEYAKGIELTTSHTDAVSAEGAKA